MSKIDLSQISDKQYAFLSSDKKHVALVALVVVVRAGVSVQRQRSWLFPILE